MATDFSKESIRIGTLVGGGDPANYIRQILPHGFESFSITFWQTMGGKDIKKMAEEVNAVLAGSNAVISSLGIYGNPLENGEKDLEALKGWEDLIDNAHLFGCDIVSGFTGRLRGKEIHESIGRFREVFTPLAQRAKDKGVRLAFENCDMGGTWKTGDYNIANSPIAWEMMFDAVPYDNLGLEWEPAHQMVGLVDPLPQLKAWAPRVFHVHGKDATIHWDVIRKYGVHSQPGDRKGYTGKSPLAPPYVEHRTPGFGDSNWSDIISELRRAGFQGSIDIEGWHDPIYRGELEMTGQVAGLHYLKRCRGGDFVPNPS